jgi:hydrogenase expression/formation protein HypE
MSVREGLDFETSIESDTCHFNDVVTRILDQFGHDIHLFRDPTRGGVATVLNEIARDSNLGIDIDQKYIKVSDDVAGACELLGLDPLYVANEGVFIAVVNESKAADILAEIQTWEHGRDAFIIGEVVESHPRQVIINSAIGGKRVVNMLLGEQLPRIC